MPYKIIAGPTHMKIERYGFQSEPIDIGSELINKDNQQAKNFYEEHMKFACQEYIKLKWTVKTIYWNNLRSLAKNILESHPNLHFDGPPWVVSTVPWKQAKYGEWFSVDKKMKILLRKEYDILNRP